MAFTLKAVPSPERTILAAAIQDRTAAERNRAQAMDRLERSESGLTSALDALRQATLAADAAAAADLERTMETGYAFADASTREARRHKDECAEAERIARQARDRIIDELPAFDDEIAAAKKSVEAAANAVVVVAAPGLMTRAEYHYAELNKARCALAFVASCLGWPPSDQSRRIESTARRFISEPDYRESAWPAAFDELLRNPNARLPE